MFQVWREGRPKTGTPGLLLHYNQTSAHTASAALVYMTENNIKIVTHPPYSLCLDPCDFFPIHLVKPQSKGEQFHGAEEARAFFEGAILPLPQLAWSGGMENLFQGLVKCIHADEGLF